MALLTGACSSGPKDFDNTNDDLRRQNIELRTMVGALEAERNELRVKLGEAQRVVPAEVLAAVPRVTSLEIDRLSGPAPRRSPSGPGDTPIEASRPIAVFVRALDGRGRFVHAVGTLRVEARLLPIMAEPSASPDHEGIVLSSVELGPGALRDAYRSGFTGTHYRADLSADFGLLERGGTLVLRARFEDALTGATHEAARTIELAPDAPPPGD